MYYISNKQTQGCYCLELRKYRYYKPYTKYRIYFTQQTVK